MMNKIPGLTPEELRRVAEDAMERFYDFPTTVDEIEIHMYRLHYHWDDKYQTFNFCFNNDCMKYCDKDTIMLGNNRRTVY